MNWLGLETLPAFLLVLTRIVGMLLTAPVFGGPAVPVIVRAGLAGLLALLLAPLVSPSVPVRPDFPAMTLAAAGELSIGLLIGFAASLLFSAVQSAGHLADLDMGVALANVLDPVTHDQVAVVSQFQLYLAAAAWLLIGGHHFLISATVGSFSAVPVAGLAAPTLTTSAIGGMATQVVVSALQLAAPTILALFLVTVALGVLARAVPDLNLFSLGYPVRLLVGLAVLAAGTGIFLQTFGRASLHAEAGVRGLIHLLGGRP